MLTSFLSNKSYIPKVNSNFVNRDNLVEKINQGLDKKLTLISAPAGFGKTSIISKWVEQAKVKVAWLSLDQADNNPIFFLSYIIGALSTIKADFGVAIQPLLKTTPNPDFLISSLITEIEEKLDKCVLVLDDFHLVENDIVTQYMNFFINNVSSKVHLIIISRTEPNLHISKLRLNQQINEIRINDLRFSPMEQKDFFRHQLKLDLSEEQLSKINSKTEGWIAGLQFAGLGMKGKDLTNFVNNLYENNSYIEEYLMDEVISNQSKEIKDFLLKTAILNSFNANICDFILEINNSKEIIKNLKHLNLFIIPLDDNADWYRYHNLFRTLLLKRLKEEKSFDLAKLHHKSILWFENNKFTFEALNHALENKDLDKYCSLLSDISMETIIKGEFLFFKSLSEVLPEEIISKYPLVCICLGWANCLTHNLDIVEKYINYAETPNTENTSNNLPIDKEIHIELLRAYYYTLYAKADFSYFKRCIDLINTVKRESKDDILKGAVERILAGLYVVTNDWGLALEAFQNAKNIGRQTKNHVVWMTSISNYASLLIFQGKLKKAKTVCEDTIKEIKLNFNNESFPLLGYVYQPLGKVCYELDNTEEALDYLNKSVNFAEKIGNKFLQIISILELALIKANDKNLKKSLEYLTKAELIFENTAIYKDIFIEFNLLKLWFIHKRSDKLNLFQEEYEKKRADLNHRNDYRELILAKILFEQGKIKETEEILNTLIEDVKTNEAKVCAIEILLFYAYFSKKNFNNNKAVEGLKLALLIGQKNSYFRIFVDHYKYLSEIFDLVLKEKESVFGEFIVKIFQEFKNKDKYFDELVEPLSEREIEILRFLSIGLTNQEIAEKLFVAIGTVKKHTNSIYSKLNVANRVSAIQKAKEIELI